uniref:Uncharacterized protein n=1 Tax=Amphimedon queenslandica TaxID=400682 RepID=A0A1X7TDH9_AMPQE
MIRWSGHYNIYATMDISAKRLIFVLLLTFCPTHIYCEFTVQPVSINTTLNSTVQFSCEVADHDFSVCFLVDCIQANREEIKNRGFQDVIQTGGGALRGVLTAKAYDINNNTNVTCVASSLSTLPVTSDTVFLMIQVPPSVKNTTVAFSNYFQNTVIFHFNIPIIVECTGEAPENATVTIQCNETVIFHNIYLIKLLLLLLSVIHNHLQKYLCQVTINILTKQFIHYTVLAGAIIGGIFAILVLIIFTCILVFLCYRIKKKKLSNDEVHVSLSPKAYNPITTEIGPLDASEIEPHYVSETGLHDAYETGPHDVSEIGPHDASKTGPHNMSKTGPHDASRTGPHDASETRPHDASETGPHDVSKIGPHDASEIEPHDASEIGPHDVSESDQSDDDHDDNSTDQPLLMKSRMESKSFELADDADDNSADQLSTKKSSTIPCNSKTSFEGKTRYSSMKVQSKPKFAKSLELSRNKKIQFRDCSSSPVQCKKVEQIPTETVLALLSGTYDPWVFLKNLLYQLSIISAKETTYFDSKGLAAFDQKDTRSTLRQTKIVSCDST